MPIGTARRLIEWPEQASGAFRLIVAARTYGTHRAVSPTLRVRIMPKHYCLDPHDPYAEREVLVEFHPTALGLILIAAIDDCDEDILPDLIDAQCDDLRRELAMAGQIPNDSGPLSGATATPAG